MRRGLLVIFLAMVVAWAIPGVAVAGATWSVQPVPLPAGSVHGSLTGVSCPSATGCFAVGYYFAAGSGTQLALAEQWNGSAWTVLTTPRPPGATAVTLAGVACTSATNCTAVGSYFAKAEPERTLAEHWNGRTWTIQATPNPAGASFSVLAAVSCPSAHTCTAVGNSETGTPNVTLAEHWNGSAWTIQATPNPAGAQATFFYGASCGSASSCVAVGSTDSGALAESWDGTSWTITATPAPPGGQLGLLAGVSCWSPKGCIAAGDFVDDAGNGQPLSESWNGSTWTLQTVPPPAGGTSVLLNAVSCRQATACTAIGQYDLGTVEHALAEQWNGSRWTAEPTAKPSTQQYLKSVSCTPAPACTAVGVIPSGNKGKPLAEQD